MRKNSLNIENIKKAMKDLGFNKNYIARKIVLSRSVVGYKIKRVYECEKVNTIYSESKGWGLLNPNGSIQNASTCIWKQCIGEIKFEDKKQ